MLQNILQVQSAPIAQLKLTHFVGLMTFTRDQFAAFFTAQNPAPTKVAAQLTRYNQKYGVLDDAYRIDDYSLDTERLKKADEDCDHTVMGVKKMTQAQQAFDFNPQVKASADRMMQAYDKFEPIQSILRAVAMGFPIIENPNLLLFADVVPEEGAEG